MKKYKKSLLIFLPILFILPALIFQTILPLFGLGRTYQIPTNSMKPTVLKGEKVFVNTLADDFKYHDIVAYDIADKKLSMNDRHLKRIVAMAGDLLSISAGKLFVNNKEICGISMYYDTPELSHWINKLQGVYEIPAGMYFMLGDNRDNSLDSRTYGLIEKKKIIGKYSFKLGFLSELIFHK
ncbi:MAG: signal peptidase I [Lentisphaeraceae bacterium]|nr:signal peptidase I [Lentisphaeraceae bacterium]